MTPMRAIRAKCLDCSGDSANEVRLCPIKDCPLYEYRFGHNPARKGICGKESPNHKTFTNSKDNGAGLGKDSENDEDIR